MARVSGGWSEDVVGRWRGPRSAFHPKLTVLEERSVRASSEVLVGKVSAPCIYIDRSAPYLALPAMGLPRLVTLPGDVAVLAPPSPATPILTAPVPLLSGAPPPRGGSPFCSCSQLSGRIRSQRIRGPDFASSDTRNP